VSYGLRTFMSALLQIGSRHLPRDVFSGVLHTADYVRILVLRTDRAICNAMN